MSVDVAPRLARLLLPQLLKVLLSPLLTAPQNVSPTIASMMAATTTATVSSILLPDDVWDDLAVFRDMVCMAIVALDSDSNDHMYKNATEIIVGAIGKDPAKPYALIDVVHDKMITQPSWASIVAIRFYK
jgi:hypothetical protein